MLQPLPFDDRLLADVTALNRQFVQLLLHASRQQRVAVDPQLVRRLDARCAEASAKWPRCPFLLFRIVADGGRSPACPVVDQYDSSVSELITLSLSFLWQLSRERLQVAEIIAGAEPGWCRQLAALDIAGLAGLSVSASLQPRLIDVPGFWHDLARKRGISALQRSSLGAAGLQLIMSGERRARVTASSVLSINGDSTPVSRR